MCGRSSATADPHPRVLYDGWPLARSPASPAATHLVELLDLLQNDSDAILALPIEALLEAPFPLDARIPERNAVFLTKPAPDTPAGRLYWEQSVLPGLAREVQAHLVHTTSAHPPLFSPIPCLCSPGAPLDDGMGRQAGVVERLRSALGRGGLAGAKAVLWPKDLPASAAQAAFQLLPPFVHPAFRMPQPRPDRFPGDFIYFPGPFTAEEAGLLKAAWLLIVPVTGDALSLLVSGFSEKGYQDFCQALQQNDLPPPMEATPPEANLAATNLAERAAAIQHAAAVVVLPRMAAWGDPVSQALACAAALVAPETPWSDARVGPAGYLVPENDARAIAAAVLTLVNQPEVAGQLRQAARLRSAGWEQEDFRQDLLEIYSACARVYPRRRTAA